MQEGNQETTVKNKQSENKIAFPDIFAEGYGVVPKKLLKSDLKPNTKLLLSYFLSFTGAGRDQCWPSIDSIARNLRLGRDTIKRSLREARGKGYLNIEHRRGRNIGTQNIYIILFPTTPFREGTGAPSKHFRGSKSGHLEGAPQECNSIRNIKNGGSSKTISFGGDRHAGIRNN